MPALPAPYADGCVEGFSDERTDYLTVIEAGVRLPTGTGARSSSHGIRSTGWSPFRRVASFRPERAR